MAPSKPASRSAWLPWLRLALIEAMVAVLGGLALLALVSVVDEPARALMPFIAH